MADALPVFQLCARSPVLFDLLSFSCPSSVGLHPSSVPSAYLYHFLTPLSVMAICLPSPSDCSLSYCYGVDSFPNKQDLRRPITRLHFSSISSLPLPPQHDISGSHGAQTGARHFSLHGRRVSLTCPRLSRSSPHREELQEEICCEANTFIWEIKRKKEIYAQERILEHLQSRTSQLGAVVRMKQAVRLFSEQMAESGSLCGPLSHPEVIHECRVRSTH